MKESILINKRKGCIRTELSDEGCNRKRYRGNWLNSKNVYTLLLIFCIIILSACGKKENDDNGEYDKYNIEHDPLGIIDSDGVIQIDPKDTEKQSDVSHTDDGSIIDNSIPASSIPDTSADTDDNISSNDDLSVLKNGEQDNDDYTSSIPVRIDKDKIVESNYKDYDNTKYSWSIKRVDNNEQTVSYETFNINEYNSFYINKNVIAEDKVIYLTFDCGYENGFTPSILDTLKKHNAKAMFFVTKYFLTENADLVIRMKEEGHMVGNHTLNHNSLPTLSVEKLKDEIYGLEDLMKKQTGYELDLFIRPPMGEYSARTLKILEDMGYASIFWSIVYVDYEIDKQPGKAFVIDHFKKYNHNGAIPLMHNVSESNAEALNEVLTYLESQGYRFGILDELKK